MTRKPRYLIVTPMKNEGPYILDWVAHHMSIGIEHFIVVTNDCDDGTDRILDRLAELGHVTHVPNPKMLRRAEGSWHVMALRYAHLFNIYRDAEWVLYSDVDEYLQINLPTPTLDAFLDQVGPSDVISFTSIPYNSNGRKTLLDKPVPCQFTQRNRPYSELIKTGSPELTAVKSMHRNAVPFRMRRNHRPVMESFSQTDYIWRDGSGRKLGADFTDTRIKALDSLTTVDLAQLNHYAIRSIEAFLIKADRGDAVVAARLERSRKYWRNYNTPGDEDSRYAALSCAAQNIRDSFARDAELADWHAVACSSHREKLARILATEEGRQLAEQIGYFK